MFLICSNKSSIKATIDALTARFSGLELRKDRGAGETNLDGSLAELPSIGRVRTVHHCVSI